MRERSSHRGFGVAMQVWQCNPSTRNQDWDIFVPL